MITETQAEQYCTARHGGRAMNEIWLENQCVFITPRCGRGVSKKSNLAPKLAFTEILWWRDQPHIRDYRLVGGRLKIQLLVDYFNG